MNDDSGFGSALMLAMLALAGLMCVATADAANVLVTQARAQAAADAAALAAAAAQWPVDDNSEDPDDAARIVAEANGSTLDSCDCPERGQRVLVTVSRATHIRMLVAAPRRVTAVAEANLDAARVFAPPGARSGFEDDG